MSGSSVPVNAGPSQQLSGAPLGANTVVYNSDPTNSVWISSVQSVSPGNGIKLNPFSTATWVGKQLWACLDTGGIAPVMLQVSDDVSTFDDIAGVAAATAAKLLAQGIPNVLTAKSLIVPTVFANNGSSTVDTTQVSTLLLSLASEVGASNPVVQLQWTTLGVNTVEWLTTPLFGANTVQWEIPVKGTTLRVTVLLSAGTSIVLALVGTNQPNTGKVRNVGVQAIPRNVGLDSGLTAAVQTMTATATKGDSVSTITQMNGLIEYSLIDYTASAILVLWIQYVTPAGVLVSSIVGSNAVASGSISGTVNHPPVPCTWGVSSNGVLAHVVGLTLIGAST